MYTRSETPKSRPAVQASQPGGTMPDEICRPLDRMASIPRKIASVPSVTTMDGTRP